MNCQAAPELAERKKKPLSEEEKGQSSQFVLDLARNFSSFYFQKMTAFVHHDRAISPVGIFLTLSMLSYGAQGQTRKNLLTALGLPKKKARMAKIGYENYFDKLANYDVELKSRIFIPPDAKPNPRFVDLSKRVFNSEIEFVNVTDGFMDHRRINEWVAAQTYNNVTKLFKPRFLGPGLSIVLVSTVYFKGTWEQAFDKSRTERREFYPLHGESFNVETMYTAGRFRHGQIDEMGASFVELPYKRNSEDDAMSMFVLLPDYREYDEWIRLVYGLRHINLTRFLNSTEKQVEIYLPKFRIETEQSINSALNEILKPELSLTEDRINNPLPVNEYRDRLFAGLEFSGNVVREPFQDKPVNFSGIFESSEGLYLARSAMKIVVEVDEEGQRTAESNGIFYNKINTNSSDRQTRSAFPETVQFMVDHPFVAIIATKGKVLTDILSLHFIGENKSKKHLRRKKIDSAFPGMPGK